VNAITTTSTSALLNGGAFYSEKSQLEVSSSTIRTSQAIDGGVFYLYDKSPLSVKSSVFDASTATGRGGVGFFAQKSGLTTPLAADLYSISFSSPTSTQTAITTTTSAL